MATKKNWKHRKELREKGPPRGRIPKNATLRDLMERKLLTRRGRQAYKQRGSSIEAVFGQMAMRGISRFLLRGVEKVEAEWSMWCMTHNLLKLGRAGCSPLQISVLLRGDEFMVNSMRCFDEIGWPPLPDLVRPQGEKVL